MTFMNNIVMLNHINLMLSWIEDSIEFVDKNKDFGILKSQLIRTQEDMKKMKEEIIQLYNVSL